MPRARRQPKPPTGRRAASAQQAPAPMEDDPLSESEDSFENLHADQSQPGQDIIESGEIIDDVPPASGQSSSQVVAVAPVAVAPPWFSRYGSLLDKMLSKQDEQSSKLIDLSDQLDCRDQGYLWRKEGLKKQHHLATKVVRKGQQALSAMNTGQPEKARQFIQEGIDILIDRMKDLRIADESDGGWETVNAYKSHPAAVDSDDDKRIRKAEKVAQEKIAAKRKPKRKYGGRNQYRGGYDRRDSSSYRSVGSDRSQDSTQRTAYVPDKRKRSSSNDLCYYCGHRGHWADACPAKDRRRDNCKCLTLLIYVFTLFKHVFYIKIFRIFNL